VAKKLPVGRKIIKTTWLIAVNYADASYLLQKIQPLEQTRHSQKKTFKQMVFSLFVKC
jgi:hypothetical protein